LVESQLEEKVGPATDAGATNFVRSTQAHSGLQCPELAQLRPQIVPWSTLCRADWVRNDCGSTSPRSLDELAQLRTHTAHYSPVMIAPLSKISAEEDYGFIATPDGREIYFHRNSVIDNAFDRLSVGQKCASQKSSVEKERERV